MKKILALICVAIFITSCGGDNNSVASNPVTNSKNIIDTMTASSDFRVGQFKKYEQLVYFRQDNGQACYYYENIEQQVLSVEADYVELYMSRVVELADGEPAFCNHGSYYDREIRENIPKSRFVEDLQMMLSRRIDPDFACKNSFSNCIDAKVVEIKDGIYESIPSRLYNLEFTLSDGRVYVIESVVSTRSIFEGLLVYRFYNKETELHRSYRKLLQLK